MTIEERRAKRNTYMKKYRLEHKEDIAYTQHKKYMNNREMYLLKAAEYRAKNKRLKDQK